MKRRPSVIRVLLAVILVGLAALVFTHWPQFAICQIENEEMVGFDEAQGLFYTTHLTSDVQKLNCYDLTTGLKRSSEALSLPIYWDQGSFLWPCMLSGDRRFLIAASVVREDVHVFKLPSLTPVRFEVPKEVFESPWAVGFSQDGGALALRCYGYTCDLFLVMDLDKAAIQVAQIKFPIPTGIAGLRSNSAPAENMHLSRDRRYLATSLIGDNSILYDMTEKKVLIKTDGNKGIARFTTDGQTLVFLPENNRGDHEALWYRSERGKWSLSARQKIELLKDEYLLQACDQYYVTGRTVVNLRTWLERLPEWARNKLTQLLPAERLYLRFWDLRTGELKPELNLDIPVSHSNIRLGRIQFSFSANSELIVSSDAQHVAWKKDGTISVWECWPRHSFFCWHCCICLVLFACWLGWPRLTKVT